jgi:ABC-type Co2+ transport system permease subunit
MKCLVAVGKIEKRRSNLGQQRLHESLSFIVGKLTVRHPSGFDAHPPATAVATLTAGPSTSSAVLVVLSLHPKPLGAHQCKARLQFGVT